MAFVFTDVFTHARRFFAVRVLLCAFLVFCAAPPADAALGFSPAVPLARILYTADTFGYLHPCVSCSSGSQGGMARRAALLRTLTHGQKRPLVLAGPNEFADDSRRTTDLPADNKLHALHGAFSRMPYTAVYLTPRTADRFAELKLPALPSGVVVSAKPVVEYYRAGDLTVACVFFPAGAQEHGKPTQEQYSDVMMAAAQAAKNASLIIGVSPWGMHLENALMYGPLFEQFHGIFGSGEGIAIPGQAMNANGVAGPLWVRSDRRGRAVNVLDIYEVPAGEFGKRSAWIDGIHFSSRLVFLEKDLPEDEEVKKIIETVPKD
ncbi:MAG: hypothetical protein DELT_00987 [Desulfovibrio sp.]